MAKLTHAHALTLEHARCDLLSDPAQRLVEIFEQSNAMICFAYNAWRLDFYSSPNIQQRFWKAPMDLFHLWHWPVLVVVLLLPFHEFGGLCDLALRLPGLNVCHQVAVPAFLVLVHERHYFSNQLHLSFYFFLFWHHLFFVIRVILFYFYWMKNIIFAGRCDHLTEVIRAWRHVVAVVMVPLVLARIQLYLRIRIRRHQKVLQNLVRHVLMDLRWHIPDRTWSKRWRRRWRRGRRRERRRGRTKNEEIENDRDQSLFPMK